MIRLRNVSKSFGDVMAVSDITLDIKAGEFFCLLGPSGCGKTTLLRILAGLEHPDSGSVEINGMDMGGVDPADRPVNIMFQNYALFPHYSVAQNIGYGLRCAGMDAAAIDARVAAMLKLVRLDNHGARMPAQLSGGQQQRVALARALARQPKVLLLDEPLAALDKKLREESRFELVDIQDSLGTTFVVVTHDQDEAMTIADRIGVMDGGALVQMGAPKMLYENPCSRFVADFLGSVSFLRGVVRHCGRKTITLDVAGVEVVAENPAADDNGCGDGSDGAVKIPRVGENITIALRPEKIMLQKNPPRARRNCFPVTVQDIAFTGVASDYRVHVEGGGAADGLVLKIHRQNLREEPDITWYEKAHACFVPESVIILPD